MNAQHFQNKWHLDFIIFIMNKNRKVKKQFFVIDIRDFLRNDNKNAHLRHRDYVNIFVTNGKKINGGVQGI